MRVVRHPGSLRGFVVASWVAAGLVVLQLLAPPAGAVLGVFVAPLWLWLGARSLLAVHIGQQIRIPGAGTHGRSRVVGVRLESSTAGVEEMSMNQTWRVSLMLGEPAEDGERERAHERLVYLLLTEAHATDATDAAAAESGEAPPRLDATGDVDVDVDVDIDSFDPATLPADLAARWHEFQPAVMQRCVPIQEETRVGCAVRTAYRVARHLDVPVYDFETVHVEPRPSESRATQTQLRRLHSKAARPGEAVHDQFLSRVIGQDDREAFELGGKGRFTTLGSFLALLGGSALFVMWRNEEFGTVLAIFGGGLLATGLVLGGLGLGGVDRRSIRVDRRGVHLLSRGQVTDSLALDDVLAVQIKRGADFLAPRLTVIGKEQDLQMFTPLLPQERDMRTLLHQRIRWFQAATLARTLRQTT